MFDKFSYKTFLHSWSPGCLLSLSLLLSKICLFYSWDSNFLFKALLDLLFKRITSITSEHAFLTFKRGLVDSSVLKGRQRGSPWATPKLQTHCACKHPGSILVAVGDDGVGHTICPSQRCVGRTGSFQVGHCKVQVIRTVCPLSACWVLLRFHPPTPAGTP